MELVFTRPERRWCANSRLGPFMYIARRTRMKMNKLWSVVVLFSLLATAAFVPSGAAQEEVAREDTFKIAIGGRIADPTNLNIYSPSVSRSDTGLHQLVYEYFFYNNLQTGEFVPWLAESYEYAPDFKSLTVKLRDGVTWSDGE